MISLIKNEIEHISIMPHFRLSESLPTYLDLTTLQPHFETSPGAPRFQRLIYDLGDRVKLLPTKNKCLTLAYVLQKPIISFTRDEYKPLYLPFSY